MINSYEVVSLSNPRNAFNNDGTVSVNPISFYLSGSPNVITSPLSISIELDRVYINRNLIDVNQYQSYVKVGLSKDFKDSTAAQQLPKSKLVLEKYKNYAFFKASEYLKSTSGKDEFLTKVNTLKNNPDIKQVTLNLPLPAGFNDSKYPQNLWTKENLELTLGFYLLKVSENDLPIQEIFIENNLDSSDLSNIPFYDVQFANYFKYYSATVNLIKSGGASLNETISIKINKTDLSDIIQIPNYPPQIPNVSITSYNNVNNKVLFLFQKNSGFSISPANDIDLFTADQVSAFQKIIKLKSKHYSPNLVFASSQGDEKYFVIYRTEVEPEAFSDIILPENIIKRLDITKLETSFADKILPNKKYYYCFRVEDLKGVMSDTTLVYEIQIIDQSGTIYMTQNVFKPERKIEFIKQIKFENRFRISPTDTQIEFPESLVPFNLVFDSLKQKQSYEEADTIISEVYYTFTGLNPQEFPKNLLKFLPINDVVKEFGNSIGQQGTQISSSDLPEEVQATGWKNNKVILANEAKKIGQFIVGLTNGLNTYSKNLVSLKNKTDDASKIELDTTIKQIGKDLLELSRLLSLYYFINILYIRQQEIINEITVATISQNSVFDDKRTFKFRVQSQNSKKKFDVNVNYKIQIDKGIKNLSQTTITKNFEILKTEQI
jgi:hypothetical protein